MDHHDHLDGELPPTVVEDPWRRQLREMLDRMDAEADAVIVEGKRDRLALRTAGVTGPIHTCAQTEGLVPFATSLSGDTIVILTDYDDTGRRLNGRLRQLIPDHRVDPRWRRELGLLLTQRGRYDIESLTNIFEPAFGFHSRS